MKHRPRCATKGSVKWSATVKKKKKNYIGSAKGRCERSVSARCRRERTGTKKNRSTRETSGETGGGGGAAEDDVKIRGDK